MVVEMLERVGDVSIVAMFEPRQLLSWWQVNRKRCHSLQGSVLFLFNLNEFLFVTKC